MKVICVEYQMLAILFYNLDYIYVHLKNGYELEKWRTGDATKCK